MLCIKHICLHEDEIRVCMCTLYAFHNLFLLLMLITYIDHSKYFRCMFLHQKISTKNLISLNVWFLMINVSVLVLYVLLLFSFVLRHIIIVFILSCGPIHIHTLILEHSAYRISNNSFFNLIRFCILT